VKGKRLLIIILLGLSLCFVSGAGYGEVKEWMHKEKTPLMFSFLLDARVNYIMSNPSTFLNVFIGYDPNGEVYQQSFPEGTNTKGKICLSIFDNRNLFTDKSKVGLLDEFKRSLDCIYSFLDLVTTDINTDVVAVFLSKEGIPLGYFYQGEYHLWEE